MLNAMIKPFHLCIPILIIIFLVVMFGCDDKESDPILFSLKPQELLIIAETDDHILFNINAESKELLHQLVIRMHDRINASIVLKDTVLNTYQFDYYYSFKVPGLPDSTIVRLDFSFTDREQHSVTLSRQVLVKNNTALLEETTGHVIFSALSGKPDAFNIDMLQPLFRADYPDSLLHFADASTDSIHLNNLSRRWISPAGYNFVKFEGFNYATASAQSVQNAYNAGIKLSSVFEIADNDIILMGFDNQAKAAIYITQVIDADSTLNDRYIFNIKRMVQ